MTSVSTRELCAWLDTTLNAASFKDYCPNGLQVEGHGQVSHIIAGVTASQALIDVAIERGADAVLVHHGWFWRGDDPRVRGTLRTRLAALLAANINLIAYHLPLDAHPTLGNNAQLAARLGLVADRDPANLIWLGSMPGQQRSARWRNKSRLGWVENLFLWAQLISRLRRSPGAQARRKECLARPLMQAPMFLLPGKCLNLPCTSPVSPVSGLSALDIMRLSATAFRRSARQSNSSLALRLTL